MIAKWLDIECGFEDLIGTPCDAPHPPHHRPNAASAGTILLKVKAPRETLQLPVYSRLRRGAAEAGRSARIAFLPASSLGRA